MRILIEIAFIELVLFVSGIEMLTGKYCMVPMIFNDVPTWIKFSNQTVCENCNEDLKLLKGDVDQLKTIIGDVGNLTNELVASNNSIDESSLRNITLASLKSTAPAVARVIWKPEVKNVKKEKCWMPTVCDGKPMWIHPPAWANQVNGSCNPEMKPLEELKATSHCRPHSEIKDKSLSILSANFFRSVLLDFLPRQEYREVSSAYMLISQINLSGRSLIYIKNKMGPRMDPWDEVVRLTNVVVQLQVRVKKIVLKGGDEKMVINAVIEINTSNWKNTKVDAQCGNRIKWEYFPGFTGAMNKVCKEWVGALKAQAKHLMSAALVMKKDLKNLASKPTKQDPTPSRTQDKTAGVDVVPTTTVVPIFDEEKISTMHEFISQPTLRATTPLPTTPANPLVTTCPASVFKSTTDENPLLSTGQDTDTSTSEPVTTHGIETTNEVSTPGLTTSDATTAYADSMWYEGKRYFAFGSQNVKKAGATAKCQSVGGNLANFYSQAHLDQILDFLRERNMTSQYFWTGMTYDPTNKILYLRDGTRVPSSDYKWWSSWPKIRSIYTNIFFMASDDTSSLKQYLWNERDRERAGVLCEV